MNRKVAGYMRIAEAVAKMGTCGRAQVGAVLVLRDHILGVGFNGSARGEPHCTDAGCILEVRRGREHCIRAIHAEVNAVVNARCDLRGATLYCTHEPCWDCLRVLKNAGVSELVFYRGSYQDDANQQEMLRSFPVVMTLPPKDKAVRL